MRNAIGLEREQSSYFLPALTSVSLDVGGTDSVKQCEWSN